MNATAIQQEILLIIHTTFSYRQWSRVDKFDNASSLSELERLEEACWNGLLYEALPEIYNLQAGNKISYIWSVKHTESFIEIDLGEYPTLKNNYSSINPYSILITQNYN